MRVTRFRLVIMVLFGVAAASAIAEPGLPGGGMGFGMRALFLDTAYWNALLPDASLPALPDGPVIMHGGFAFVNVNPWFRVGFQGYGIVHGDYQDEAVTEFAGDIVGFSVDFRHAVGKTVTVFGGGTLSCGRFYFNSLSAEGDGLRASSGAIYVEPYAGMGLTLFSFFEIRAAVSYVIARFSEDCIWMGPGTPVPVSPSGPIVSVTLGLPLPSFME